jgi:hypothetical protein
MYLSKGNCRVADSVKEEAFEVHSYCEVGIRFKRLRGEGCETALCPSNFLLSSIHRKFKDMCPACGVLAKDCKDTTWSRHIFHCLGGEELAKNSLKPPSLKLKQSESTTPWPPPLLFSDIDVRRRIDRFRNGVREPGADLRSSLFLQIGEDNDDSGDDPVKFWSSWNKQGVHLQSCKFLSCNCFEGVGSVM